MTRVYLVRYGSKLLPDLSSEPRSLNQNSDSIPGTSAFRRPSLPKWPRHGADDGSSVDNPWRQQLTSRSDQSLSCADTRGAVTVVRLYELGDGTMRWAMLIVSSAQIIAGSSAAFAQGQYADPAGSGPIVNALTWLQSTLLGTVATVAAVIAVGVVGFLMLTGRMNWRYGATVILGCFILFGAASIVAGIQSAAAAGS